LTVIKPDRTHRVGPHAAEILEITDHKPRCPPFGYDDADPLPTRARIGSHEYQANIGDAPVRDEDLIGIDQVMRSITDGGGLNTGSI
jgi:hypothetical protein